jgi:hypothetical protein
MVLQMRQFLHYSVSSFTRILEVMFIKIMTIISIEDSNTLSNKKIITILKFENGMLTYNTGQTPYI